MSNKKDENNTDFFLSYILNNSGKKIAIYLPFNDNYLPIAEAIIKVCSLFSDSLKDKKAKDCIEAKKTVESKGDILVVCNEEERAKMIKHPNCYWVETKKLSIEELADPKKGATEEFSEIVCDVYEELMRELSH